MHYFYLLNRQVLAHLLIQKVPYKNMNYYLYQHSNSNQHASSWENKKDSNTSNAYIYNQADYNHKNILCLRKKPNLRTFSASSYNSEPYSLHFL